MRITTITNTATDIVTTPSFIKFTALALLSLSLLFFTHHFFFTSSATSFSIPLQPPPHVSLPPPSPSPSPSPPLLATPRKPVPQVVRTGIVDETGAMSSDFEVGEFYIEADSVDELNDLIGEVESDVNMKEKKGKGEKGVVGKYEVCDERLRNYIPCLDDGEETTKVDNHDRHCARKGLDCLVPRPKGYKTPIPWPKSRHGVWFNNMPNTHLVEGKRGQNWIKVKDSKFIFPRREAQFPNGADNYLYQISQMVPEIAFGHHTRVALDVDCGIGSFGASLMQRNVTTLSIAPKDARENQIQFALERGVPAMVAVFARHRLLYPSQAFDLIHCSRCQVSWTHDDGSLLLEANRMLRAGGYFAWAMEPQYKDGKILLEQRKELEDLAARICWELVKKDGYIAVWRKPLNNSCYLHRSTGVQPPICDTNDDPDNVWFVGLRACITPLPENGYGADITTWPVRLHHPPDRLQSIKMDADISRKEIFRAESKYWNEIIDSYVRVFRWKEMKLRNVMDMRAGLGGFAAALHDLQIDCWVMNIVPVSGFNTLPVIYDRGLIGVMHDWCEPFDTYPRTYDLLHAAGLFSVEQKRCNISVIMLEMDRMLRPGGRVYIRDKVSVVGKLQKIASAMGWTPALHDTSEGPHASWKILICEKRM